MKYINIIEDAIEYIEDNLMNELTLDIISKKYYLSSFYFHRIFSAVLGMSLKKYILKRKLNKSLEFIYDNSISIIDITFKLGFSSQSSYTRAFKACYGFTPIVTRKNNFIKIERIPEVINRTFKNFNSDIVTDFLLVEKDEIEILGFELELDLDNKNTENIVKEKSEEFIVHNNLKDLFDNCDKYSVLYPKIKGTNKLKVFFGIENNFNFKSEKYIIKIIPPMLYAKFSYVGDLLDIGDIVINDLMRWGKISKIKIEIVEALFLQVYDQEYDKNKKFTLLYPIKLLQQDLDI